MADVNANIGVHIDTSGALAELKALQRQLATFHSSVAKNSAAAAQAQKGLQTNLLNSINATGKFHAQMGVVRSSTDSFTHALEKNKLSMREYFRFAGGSTRTFGKLFKSEFSTIGKVAEERVKKMQTQYIKMGRDASGAIKSMSITPRTLDMTNYANKTAVAAQKQAVFNQLLKQGSTNILNFGKNTQWSGRQLMVGFTIPLMYFGGAAAKVFIDLEKQAVRFKRVYGDMFTTTEETNDALESVKQLAEEFTKYGVAVAQTMEMAANAAAMGKTGADLTAQVAQATRLAVLGGVEQAQALETTISVTNAFGVAAEDLANKVNFLNAVENQTVVSIEDLTIAIPKAGPVVKQLGGSVEDLAFFLTAMKEGGINASEGANALKSGLASLINPTKKASDMLAGFGINIRGIVETNKGNIRQTVIDFSRALDTIDPLNRARAIEQLFGKFQFSRLSTLFQNVTKDGTQAARVLQLAGDSIEELAILSERELGVLEDSIATDFKESIEKLKLAIAPIGGEFLKAITPIAKSIGSFLEKFNNLGDGTKKFIVIATTLVGVIGPVLLMTFGLLANGVANIIKLFITMRSGFLRAGTNTQLLAQQTSYLNTEQLEAATVAASLNQAHTRLTQSFNMETTAVRLLRQAYIDATFAAANFARANPGMMMPKGAGSGKVPKKFASGVTKVPGSGNKDTVPSMLTPGEAVIPAPVAQDPRFRPIIDAMVNGTLQGFNDGVTDVKVNPIKIGDKEFNASSVRQEKVVKDILNKFEYDKKTNTFTYTDPVDPAKSGTFTAKRLMERLNQRKNDTTETRNRVNWTQVQRDLEIGPSGAQRGTGKSSTKDPKITKLVGIAAEKNPIFTKEDAHLNKVLKDRNINLTPGQLADLRGSQDPTGTSFRSVAAHTNPMFALDSQGNKIFDPRHLVSDKQFINNYVQGLGKSTNLNNLLASSDSNFQKTLGITPNEIKKYRKELAKLQLGYHPTNKTSADALARFSSYDYGLTKKPYALLTSESLGFRLREGFYGAKGMPSLEKIRKNANLKGSFQIAGRPTSTAIAQNKQNIVLAMNGEYLNDAKSKKSTNITPLLGREKLPNERGGGPKDNIALNVDPKTQSITKNPIYGGPGSVGPRGLIARGINRPAAQNEYVPKGTTATPGMAVSQVQAGFKAEQNSLRRNIEKVKQRETAALKATEKVEQQRIAALKQETKIVQEKNKISTQIIPLTKEDLKNQKREVRAQRAQRVGRVAGPVASIAGIGAMAGFMTGNNNVGMAMIGISALASIAPMLTNPLGLFVAGLVGVTAAILFFKKQMDKARQKGIDLANAMSMTDKKLIELSKITGRVSATEAANRKRQNLLSGLSEKKREFGQNVLQSDIGKKMVEDMSKQRVSGRSEEDVARNFANQLAVSVTQGAITTDQARSIAVALGDELGNYEIPALISGQLVRILGPDGQNLESDPISVLLNVQKSSMNDVQAAFDDAIAGANVSAIEKSMPLYQRILDLLNPANPGGVVGQKIGETNAALSAQAIQTGLNAVSQGQGQLDVANKYYDTKLKTAKTEKEIETIEGNRKNALDEINSKNAANLKTIISLKNQISQSSFNATIKSAVDTLYKDANSNTKKLINNALLGLEQIKDLDLRTTLQIGMATGSIKEGVASKILEYATDSKDFSTNLKLLISSQGTDDAMSVITLLGLSKANADTVSLFIKYQMENKEDFSTFLSSVTALSLMSKTYGFEFDLNVNGKEKLETALAAVKQIQGLDTNLTAEVVAKLAKEKPEEWAAFYAQWDSLTLNGKNKTVDSTVKIAFDVASKDKPLLKRILEGGKSEDTLGEILGLGGAIPGVIAKPVEPKDPVDPKPRNTTFDDILQTLKRTRDATIDVTKGAKELMRVLGGTKDITLFNGIDQQLSKLDANSDFIDFVGGLENAVKEKIIKINKKGVVSFGEFGEAAKKAYDEKQLGLFSATNAQAINESMKQRDAFVKLKVAGLDTASAQELLADKTFMVSLAAQKNSGEIKKMIKEYKNLKAVEKETQEIIDPVQAFKDQTKKELEYYDFLEKQARASVKLEIDRINKLIDANDRLIETKERAIEEQINRPIDKFNQDLAIIDKATEGINKKYDAQQEALEKISNLNEEISQQEKGRLSLADALTRGDISAAASAAQQMRSDAAQNAMGRSSGALQAARESELKALTAGGLTRAQIEEKIYNLEQKRLPLVAKIVELQDDNYKLQTVTLRAQEDSLKKTLEGIDAARFAYERQIIEIEGAQFAALGFNKILLDGETILKRMKALWDSINSAPASQPMTQIIDPGKYDKIQKDLTKEFKSMGIEAGAAAGLAGSSARLQAQGDAYFRANPNIDRFTGATKKMYGGKILSMAVGGPVPKVKYTSVPTQSKGYSQGGLIPKYMFAGGKIGSDTVPAMLTPGEFVMNRRATDQFGPLLSMLNESKYPSMIGSSYAGQGGSGSNITSVSDNSSSVYNYNVGITVPQSNANPSDIARAVIGQIKYIDNQRIRGQR